MMNTNNLFTISAVRNGGPRPLSTSNPYDLMVWIEWRGEDGEASAVIEHDVLHGKMHIRRYDVGWAAATVGDSCEKLLPALGIVLNTQTKTQTRKEVSCMCRCYHRDKNGNSTSTSYGLKGPGYKVVSDLVTLVQEAVSRRRKHGQVRPAPKIPPFVPAEPHS